MLRSRLGWTLAAIYVGLFVWKYLAVLPHRGTFLYDLWLDVLALPYVVIVGRVLLGSPTFALHAHEPWGLVPAVLFCAALLLLLGAGIEHFLQRGWRWWRGRREHFAR